LKKLLSKTIKKLGVSGDVTWSTWIRIPPAPSKQPDYSFFKDLRDKIRLIESWLASIKLNKKCLKCSVIFPINYIHRLTFLLYSKYLLSKILSRFSSSNGMNCSSIMIMNRIGNRNVIIVPWITAIPSNTDVIPRYIG